VPADLQDRVAGNQPPEDRKNRDPLRHPQCPCFQFARHAGPDRLLNPRYGMTEISQLGEGSARPWLVCGVGHGGARDEIQGQVVDADLFRFSAGVEHEMPAQQGRSRLNAEQGRQFLICGDFGVVGGELVFLPLDGMVFGKRRAGFSGLAGARGVPFGHLARINGVPLHRPPPDLRPGAHHGAAAATRFHQALEPEQGHRVPDHDFRYAIGAAQFLHGGQPRARRMAAGQYLLAQFVSNNKIGGTFLHGDTSGPRRPPRNIMRSA